MSNLSFRFGKFELRVERPAKVSVPSANQQGAIPPVVIDQTLPATRTQISIVDAIVAEYAVLRQEIDLYHDHQKQIMNFTVLTIAALISAPFTAHVTTSFSERPALFLAFPPVFTIFGLMFADITIRILRVADYLHNCARKKLMKHCGEDIWRWELFKKNVTVFNPFIAHILDRVRWAIFILPSVASIGLFFEFHAGKHWSKSQVLSLVVDMSLILFLLLLIILIQETHGSADRELVQFIDNQTEATHD